MFWTIPLPFRPRVPDVERERRASATLSRRELSLPEEKMPRRGRSPLDAGGVYDGFFSTFVAIVVVFESV